LSISIIRACLVPARGVGFSAGAALPGLAALALAAGGAPPSTGAGVIVFMMG
jgi:hypothetical protein